MAFCSLPCWTYFSALARTFCLLKPNSAIRASNSGPWCSFQESTANKIATNPLNAGGCSRVRSRRATINIGEWPTGQGQLYVWKSWKAWLPRVTERECTEGNDGASGACYEKKILWQWPTLIQKAFPDLLGSSPIGTDLWSAGDRIGLDSRTANV